MTALILGNRLGRYARKLLANWKRKVVLKRRYSKKQLDLLRKGVLEYRFAGESDGGKPYSWNSISEAIKEKTGADIPFKNLSKFAQGIPARGGSETNRREYPKELANNGLEYLIDFLTEETDGFVKLSKSEFENQERETRWPEHLQSYFDCAENLSFIDTADLAGIYHAESADGEQYKLKIEPDPVKQLMSFSVSAKTAKRKSSGWLVKSNHEQIIMIGRDIQDSDAQAVHFVQGFDNKLYRTSSADMLVIFDYKHAVDHFTLPEEQEEILTHLQSEMMSDLYVFTKEVKT